MSGSTEQVVLYRQASMENPSLPQWRMDLERKKKELYEHQVTRSSITTADDDADSDSDSVQTEDSELSDGEEVTPKSGGYNFMTGEQFNENDEEQESLLDKTTESTDSNDSEEGTFRPGRVNKLVGKWTSNKSTTLPTGPITFKPRDNRPKQTSTTSWSTTHNRPNQVTDRKNDLRPNPIATYKTETKSTTQPSQTTATKMVINGVSTHPNQLAPVSHETPNGSQVNNYTTVNAQDVDKNQVVENIRHLNTTQTRPASDSTDKCSPRSESSDLSAFLKAFRSPDEIILIESIKPSTDHKQINTASKKTVKKPDTRPTVVNNSSAIEKAVAQANITNEKSTTVKNNEVTSTEKPNGDNMEALSLHSKINLTKNLFESPVPPARRKIKITKPEVTTQQQQQQQNHQQQQQLQKQVISSAPAVISSNTERLDEPTIIKNKKYTSSTQPQSPLFTKIRLRQTNHRLYDKDEESKQSVDKLTSKNGVTPLGPKAVTTQPKDNNSVKAITNTDAKRQSATTRLKGDSGSKTRSNIANEIGVNKSTNSSKDVVIVPKESSAIKPEKAILPKDSNTPKKPEPQPAPLTKSSEKPQERKVLSTPLSQDKPLDPKETSSGKKYTLFEKPQLKVEKISPAGSPQGQNKMEPVVNGHSMLFSNRKSVTPQTERAESPQTVVKSKSNDKKVKVSDIPATSKPTLLQEQKTSRSTSSAPIEKTTPRSSSPVLIEKTTPKAESPKQEKTTADVSQGKIIPQIEPVKEKTTPQIEVVKSAVKETTKITPSVKPVAKSVADIPVPTKPMRVKHTANKSSSNNTKNELSNIFSARQNRTFTDPRSESPPITNIDDIINKPTNSVFDSRKSLTSRKVPEYEKIHEGKIIKYLDVEEISGKSCLTNSDGRGSTKKIVSFINIEDRKVHEYESENSLISRLSKESGCIYFDDPDELQAAADRSVDEPTPSLSSTKSKYHPEYQFGRTVVHPTDKLPDNTIQHSTLDQPEADEPVLRPADNFVGGFSSGGSDMLF